MTSAQLVLTICTVSVLSYWAGLQASAVWPQSLVRHVRPLVSGRMWKLNVAGLGEQGEPEEGANWGTLPLRQLHIDDPTMESAQWAPVVFSECRPWMRNQSAPCYREYSASDTNLEVAEELAYPDFRLREPSFLNVEQRNLWVPRLAHGPKRAAADRARHNLDGWVHYLGQTGQVMVFRDVVLRPTLASGGWGPGMCMQHDANHSPFMYPARLRDEPTTWRPPTGKPTALLAAAMATASTMDAAAAAVAVAAAQRQAALGNTSAADPPAPASAPVATDPELAAAVTAADERMLPYGTARPGAAAAFGFDVIAAEALAAGGPAAGAALAASAAASGMAGGMPAAGRSAKSDVPAIVDSVVLATSPDSGHWQHWLDRASHVLMQAAEHVSNETRVVTGMKVMARPPWQPTLWRAVGVADPETTVTHTFSLPQTGVLVRRFVYACRAPLIHPYFALLLAEHAVQLARGPGAQRTLPLEQKKVVIYASRKPREGSSDIHNGGRNVCNEEELLPAIEALLAERGRGERLVLFEPGNFTDFPALVRFFNEEVAAIIGPHGGALHNQWWMGRDTLTVELMPTTKPELVVFWEHAAMLGQAYWPLVYEAIPGSNHDINVTVSEVVEVLRRQLGVPPLEATLQESYPWKLPHRQRRRRRRRRQRLFRRH